MSAIEGGAEAPDLVLVTAPSTAGARTGAEDDLPAAARAAAQETLALLQAWLAAEQLVDTRLVLLTERAVAVEGGLELDLAAAPLAGLLRSAQSEHPGRFATIDGDGAEASHRALGGALGASAEEPQLALREGAIFVPRLARQGVRGQPESAPPIDPERTVLVTGGTGGLGALVARHLVAEHGARHLLLASRRGPGGAGAAELQAPSSTSSAPRSASPPATSPTAPRSPPARLRSPPSDPLGAVVHAAGVLDDGVLESLDAERLDAVLRAQGRRRLAPARADPRLDLAAFVLFSSAAGAARRRGQANYAAANAFLDALAQQRRASGLPATSLAWGPWAERSRHGRALVEDRARRRSPSRSGAASASADRRSGLTLFDAALASARPLIAPLRLRRHRAAQAGLRRCSAGGPTRAWCAARPACDRPAARCAERLAGVPEAERREAASSSLSAPRSLPSLGHASADAVEPDRAFKDLGFDSLAAVELRNRLDAATGLRLPATIVFDYPTAARLASHLLDQLRRKRTALTPQFASATAVR